MRREVTFVAKARCLHCTRMEISRGCCPTHYNAFRNAVVNKKKTTWETLEKSGLVRRKERNFIETVLEGIS